MADPRGAPGTRPLHKSHDSFVLTYKFHETYLELAPPTGNPGSATVNTRSVKCTDFLIYAIYVTVLVSAIVGTQFQKPPFSLNTDMAVEDTTASAHGFTFGFPSFLSLQGNVFVISMSSFLSLCAFCSCEQAWFAQVYAEGCTQAAAFDFCPKC